MHPTGDQIEASIRIGFDCCRRGQRNGDTLTPRANRPQRRCARVRCERLDAGWIVGMQMQDPSTRIHCRTGLTGEFLRTFRDRGMFGGRT